MSDQLPVNLAIRGIMAEKKIKLIHVAKNLNVGCSTITRQIGEGSNPSLSTLSKYAKELGVKVSYIVERAESIKGDK